MKVLFWSVLLFCLAFVLHLILWKIHLPRRQTQALLYIFLGTLLAGLFILWNEVLYISIFGISAPDNLSEYLHISLFVISLTLAYIITYSALEVDSPSLVMIMSIADAGSDGLDKKRFEQLISDDILIMPRIRDLLRDNMVYIGGEKYKLTAKGLVFVRIVIFYRQLLNISQKGG